MRPFASAALLLVPSMRDIAAVMPFIRLALLRVLPIMLLSVMVSAMAPRGYMPSVGADGFRMVLCAGVVDAEALAAVAADPGAAAFLTALKQAQDQHGGDGDDAPSACPFAGVASVDMPSLADFTAPIAFLATPTLLPPGTIVRARHHAATPPATGPPQLI